VEEHRRTSFSHRGLKIHDAGGETTELDLFSGAMHYWRIRKSDWGACLAAMHSLGLRVVETYVPWAIHEREPGRLDWNGDLDLAAFLDEVEKAGMHAILRPGPHINAELTFFGFPERIVRDPAMQARSGRDTPVWLPAPPRMFPVPSYAAAGFVEQASAWLEGFAKRIAGRLAPDGPVIAIQVDNESQMFFRVGAFDHDYHPDALVWWREFAGDDVEAPRKWSPERAGTCARWVAFKDEYTRRSLAWMAAVLRDNGLGGTAMFHNLPPTDPLHVDLPRAEGALGGVVGLDFYHNAHDYQSYHRRALYLAGAARILPYAPELGIGGPPWLLPMSTESQQNVILGVLSGGVRAFNLYMTVDRERWYGAPVDTNGELREPATWLQRLFEILDDVGWTRLRRHAPVALILSRAEARFATASSVADPFSPVLGEFLGLGPAGAAELALDSSSLEQRRWTAAVQAALALAQVPYDILDEHVPIEQLGRYEAVVLPTLSRIDRGLWERLHLLDGTRVILGPEHPTRDEWDQPLQQTRLPRHAGLIREASLDDLEGLADDLAGVAGDLCEYWITDGTDPVDCSIFEDRGGRARVLFVANRADKALNVDVIVPSGATLTDLFAGETLASDGGDEEAFVAVGLDPHQVRMFEVGGIDDDD
jgi:beta-galactosidase